MSEAPVGGAPFGGRTITIIGAGFSGTMVAAHLLRKATAPLRVVLAERTGQFSRGAAYSTTKAVHRLNVAAGRMGAYPDREGDFLDFLRRTDPATPTGAFVPRMRYGEYLGTVLDEAAGSAAGGVTLVRRSDEATAIDISPVGAVVRFRTGEAVESDRVVLAIGNPAPGDPLKVDRSLIDSGLYFNDPWRPGKEAPCDERPVLLIGTGLTMFDVALDLHQRGQRGPILAISRRGIVPTTHRSPSLPPSHLEPWNELESWDGSALALLRLVRQRIRRQPEGEWREVINSLRPLTQRIWKAMALTERRRFLEHVRPFWESARHRAPDDVGAAIRALMDSGQLRVRAGRLLALTSAGTQIEASVRGRGESGPEVLRFARAINCTGPRCDYTAVGEPLVCQLLTRGLIVPDRLRLGLECGDDGALLGASGIPSEFLFTLGPPRRPGLWETTAVPELRVQARDLATRLLQF